MGSVNRVILIGHLGADPEMRYTAASKAVCNLRLATTESWKDKSGAKQEKTEWHRLVAWGQTAELCGKYLEKGRQIYVEGKLETSSYEKDGEKRYSTQVVADKVVFLGGGGERERQPDNDRGKRPAPPSRDVPPPDDDCPF